MDVKSISLESKGVDELHQVGADASSGEWNYYFTYGMCLASEIELPELTPSQKIRDNDVEITIGSLVDELDRATVVSPWLQFNERVCQLQIDGVAGFRIEDGRHVMIDGYTLPGSSVTRAAGDIRVYLLGTVMGIMLHQRHWLPLHVSALETPAGVWAFTGHSGAGKSTLGAWLHYTQGWPLVSDDVAVIKPEEEEPNLYAGPPRLKLWKDALASLGISESGLVRDLTRTEKYHLTLQQGFQHAPQPLQALVVLERAEEGEAASLQPVTGVAAFQAVMATLYRPEMGHTFNNPERLLRDCARLASQIEVYRFRRPWELDEMETYCQPLLQQIMKGGVDD
jgi:hypothetical protein